MQIPDFWLFGIAASVFVAVCGIAFKATIKASSLKSELTDTQKKLEIMRADNAALKVLTDKYEAEATVEFTKPLTYPRDSSR